MTHGSLFSGTGGFDLAAEWMGWENKFNCEINEFGRKVLNYYWPKAKSYADIKATDFIIWRGRVDVLTGGFPCQPYSVAGKRLGKEDERHLWPEMLRAIREIQPRWVVGENVRGIISWNGGMVFDEVQADLEAEGYEVLPFLLPAAGVNAPHRRDRIWFVAHTKDGGDNRRPNNVREKVGRQNPECNTKSVIGREVRTASDTFGIGQQRAGKTRNRRNGFEDDNKPVVANTDRQQRCEGRMYSEGPNEAERHISAFDSRNGRGCWQNFPTQPPVRSRNDGLSFGLVGITVSKHRNESLKALGNAIVPQVALQIFKTIELYEKLNVKYDNSTRTKF